MSLAGDLLPEGIGGLRHRRRETRRAFLAEERRLAERAVDEAGGNVTEAAARLGIHRVKLRKLMKKADRE